MLCTLKLILLLECLVAGEKLGIDGFVIEYKNDGIHELRIELDKLL